MAKNFLMIAAACFFIIAGLMFVAQGFGFVRGFGHRGYGYYDNAYRGGHGGCGGYYRY